MDNIKIAKRLHNIKKVIIFAHFDCGAYGGNDAFKDFDDQIAKLSEAVRAAAEVVIKEVKDVEVEGYITVLINGHEGGIYPVTI